MDRTLRKIAFVCEEFSVKGNSQQLLDRFLIGYPRDGEFHRCGAEVHAWAGPGVDEAEVGRRVADQSLHRHGTVQEAAGGADGIVFVPGHVQNAGPLKKCIEAAREGAAVFVYGAIAGDAGAAKEIVSLAGANKVALASGTSPAVTWRLPEVDVSAGAPVRRALIVVQGESPMAELYGLDGLLPVLERRAKGERGVRSVRGVKGEAVWTEEVLPRRLLEAAISRSDSPQGDPVKDGRTQDLVGLGLAPKLAKNPRAWVMEHTDGVRSTIAVLDGVVADFNFAVELGDGKIVSAQVYRPPGPQRHEFSRVAEVIEKFFASGKAPWLVRRSVLTAGLLGVFAKGEEGSIRTEELAF